MWVAPEFDTTLDYAKLQWANVLFIIFVLALSLVKDIGLLNAAWIIWCLTHPHGGRPRYPLFLCNPSVHVIVRFRYTGMDGFHVITRFAKLQNIISKRHVHPSRITRKRLKQEPGILCSDCLDLRVFVYTNLAVVDKAVVFHGAYHFAAKVLNAYIPIYPLKRNALAKVNSTGSARLQHAQEFRNKKAILVNHFFHSLHVSHIAHRIRIRVHPWERRREHRKPNTLCFDLTNHFHCVALVGHPTRTLAFICHVVVLLFFCTLLVQVPLAHVLNDFIHHSIGLFFFTPDIFKNAPLSFDDYD